jgi:hypothetical protein
MKNANRFLTLATFLSICFCSMLNGQERREIITGEDTVISTPFFTASAGWTLPFGEMGNRYDPFININTNLGWKTDKNWIYYCEFGFQFGSDNVKIKNDILSGMLTNTSDPFVIGQDGTNAGVVAYNRNLSLSIFGGKVIPLWFSNPNSRLMITLGAGFLQHQIIYQPTLTEAPQIEGDYALGYDRQMRGAMVSGFLGYIHMSKKNFANFYLGVQVDNSWTKMTRDYQFDLRRGDNNLYYDGMLTFKIGWMFPFYGRSADKIYY